jgi:ankyrin repeat protein
VTGNTPLMYAAMENKTLIIERMIELGCDIHAKNKVSKRKKKEKSKKTDRKKEKNGL